MVENDLTALRLHLRNAGFHPLPVEGKAPRMPGWQQKFDTNKDEIRLWSKTYHLAQNTGVLAKLAPAIDIDITAEDAAEAVEALARDQFEEHGDIYVRCGKPPKRLIPLRTDEPFAKLSRTFITPNGEKQKIEVLGEGQQYVVAGIHPDTHKPYRWHRADLRTIKREDLPYVRREDVERFLEAVVKLLTKDFGFIEQGGNGAARDLPHVNDAPPTAPEAEAAPQSFAEEARLRSALAAIPADEKVLAEKFGDSHDTWVKIGRAIERLDWGEQGFAIWRDWCKQSPKFNEAGLRTNWASFQRTRNTNANPITVATVFHLAQQFGWTGPEKVEQNEDELEFDETTDICGIDWLWPDRFARGKIGLIAGLPDYGKGQIAAFISAAITTGIELPCEEGKMPCGDVIWFSSEDAARDTIRPRLLAAGADINRVHIVKRARVNGQPRTFNLVSDLPLLRKAVKRFSDTVAIIIDPISAYLGVGKVDGRSATDVRGVLTPLTEFAEELHVAVIGIAHFNKKDDVKSALLRVSDSIAYVAAARHVYAVLDDPEDKDCKLFIKAKNNLASDKKALRYGVGVNTVGHDAKLGVDIKAPFIVWHPQHVEITANEAMAAAGNHTAKRQAREFLLQRLEVGPMKQTDLIEEAKQDGIAEKTLRRAKKELGVKSYKEKGKTDGDWFWELPPKKQTREN